MDHFILNPNKEKPNDNNIYSEDIAMKVPLIVKLNLILCCLMLLLGICMIERVKRKIVISVTKMDSSRDSFASVEQAESLLTTDRDVNLGLGDTMQT